MSRLRRTSLQGPKDTQAPGPAVVDEVQDAVLEGGARLQQLEQLQQPGAAKNAADAVVAKNAFAPVQGLEHIPQERTAAQMGALQLLQLKEPIAGGGTGRIFLERAMADLANDGFSPAAQRRFIDDLRAKLKLGATERDGAHLSKTQKRDLAWVASMLRQSVDFSPSSPQTRLDDVAEFFEEQGQRLRWFDKYDPAVHHGSLDRLQFRAEIRSIIDDARKNHGGVLNEQHMGAVLSRLTKVTDVDDMQWARYQLSRHVVAGEISIPERLVIHGRNGRPDKVVNLREKFDKFMADRLVSKVDVREVGLRAHQLRQALEAAYDPSLPEDKREARFAALDEARNSFAKDVAAAAADKKDPDALFAAKRHICRELGERKCGLPEGKALRDLLVGQIDAKLATGDRLDRYTRKREVETLRKSGVISDSEAAVMRVAVASSVTETEFRATTTYFDQTLKLYVFSLIAKIMDEVAQTITRNMSDDEYDANGNVRVSGAEKRRLELERLLQRLQYERLLLEEGQRQRAHVERVVVKAVQTRSQGARTVETSLKGLLTTVKSSFDIGRIWSLINQFHADAVRVAVLH